MRLKTLAAIAALLGVPALVQPAMAGAAGDRAMQRIQAIGAGDIPTITAAYAPGATLHWVGGPLDGTYSGAQLGETWTKFTKAQGALKASVANLQESVNPKGTTVTANVLFSGQNQVKVRYVLTYRDDKLVGEIWQIDPALAVAAAN